MGKTEILGRDRESEVIEYLEKNYYIDKFIILDDGLFGELSKYQIRTDFENGFSKEKYDEAFKLISS